MANLTKEQHDLFNALYESKVEDYKTFRKREYKGIWTSAIEKYSETAHFVYELLQNADDAGATYVEFILKSGELIFKHNGTKHFDVTPVGSDKIGDINSITGIGFSSKEDDNQNKIGKFGVGFKSVFQYTVEPRIYDDIYKFKIQNYIIPILLEEDHEWRNEGETLFVFPFKNPIKSFNEISHRLNELHNPLLFLHNLERIKWRIDGDSEWFEYSKEVLAKQDSVVNNEEIHMDLVRVIEPNEDKYLFLFSRDYEIISEDGKTHKHAVNVGYYFDKQTQSLVTAGDGKVYCFFPTEESFNTCFISHAPFLLNDSRQSILKYEEHNETLVEHIADLAMDALVVLRDYKMASGVKLINDNIAELIPAYDRYGFSMNMFRSAMERSIERIFKNESLLISRSGEYLHLDNAFKAVPLSLEILIKQKQLVELKYEDAYDIDLESTPIDFISSKLAKAIRNRCNVVFEKITEYNTELFAADLSPEFMSRQEMPWVISLYRFLQADAVRQWRSTESANVPLEKMAFRKAPIIKTQRGEWVAPFINGITPNVFLPLSKESTEDYNTIAQEYMEQDVAVKFFHDLEITQPDEYDFITNVLLRKYKEPVIDGTDEDLIEDMRILYRYYLSVRGTERETPFITE